MPPRQNIQQIQPVQQQNLRQTLSLALLGMAGGYAYNYTVEGSLMSDVMRPTLWSGLPFAIEFGGQLLNTFNLIPREEQLVIVYALVGRIAFPANPLLGAAIGFSAPYVVRGSLYLFNTLYPVQQPVPGQHQNPQHNDNARQTP